MKVLHVLLDGRGLETFPSVYNALYLWKKRGGDNYIATSSNCEGFEELIHNIYEVKGTWKQVAYQLSNINNYFDIIMLYEPKDVQAFALNMLLKPKIKYKSLVYHSLEIPTQLMANKGFKSIFNKLLLTYCYSKVSKLIIQDEMRLKYIVDNFPVLKKAEPYLVPNSFINSIEPMSSALPWFDEIRAKSKCLVIYTGSLERWALPEDLFDAINSMSGVTFLFSGWSRDGHAQFLIEKKHGNNMYFHLGVKNRSDLNYIVAHSDIGLAYYHPRDENEKLMGLSSGKIMKYLSMGKPVITNELPYLSDYIKNKGVGISTDLKSIGAAIFTIKDNYHIYKASLEKYNADCDFESSYIRFMLG